MDDLNLNCKAIPTEEVKMGALIKPDTNVYRAVWKGKQAVAVKIVGELEVEHVSLKYLYPCYSQSH